MGAQNYPRDDVVLTNILEDNTTYAQYYNSHMWKTPMSARGKASIHSQTRQTSAQSYLEK